MNQAEILRKIEEHPVYKQVLADSFGGVMYNVANRSKYDTNNLFALWEMLDPAHQEAAGGIMKGAFNFLSEADNA